MREQRKIRAGVEIDALRGQQRLPARDLRLHLGEGAVLALDVAQRALDIGMYAQAHDRFGECDVMVVPSDLREYGIFDSRHIPEMEAAGYAAAMAQMEAIRRAVS